MEDNKNKQNLDNKVEKKTKKDKNELVFLYITIKKS